MMRPGARARIIRARAPAGTTITRSYLTFPNSLRRTAAFLSH